MNKLITITGRSGCGKTSLANGLTNYDPNRYRRCVTMTTRDPRAGEINGEDYTFVSTEFFLSCVLMGELIEWTRFDDNLYGLLACSVNNILDCGKSSANAIFCCDPSGVKKAREKFPGRTFSIFLDVDREVAKARMLSRGDTIDSVETRLTSDDSIFKFDPLLYDLILKSGNLSQDVNTVVRLLSE